MVYNKQILIKLLLNIVVFITICRTGECSILDYLWPWSRGSKQNFPRPDRRQSLFDKLPWWARWSRYISLSRSGFGGNNGDVQIIEVIMTAMILAGISFFLTVLGPLFLSGFGIFGTNLFGVFPFLNQFNEARAADLFERSKYIEEESKTRIEKSIGKT